MLEVLPSVPSPTLSAELVERLAQHAHAARGTFAPETERALRKASAAFTSWATGQGVSPLPASPATVAAYVDALGVPFKEGGKAAASIRQAVWGVSVMHRAAGLSDPTRESVVRFALQRMAKRGTRQRQAVPIGYDRANLIQHLAGTSLAARRDVALMRVMRDLLARRSEAVALHVEDVTLDDDDGQGGPRGASAIIRFSKTDQTGEGAVRWLAPATVKALEEWKAAAGITSGPIFRAVNKAGAIGAQLTPAVVPRILKRLAQRADMPAEVVKGISGHSCRVGMAQDLVAAGAELPAVMQAGRWKSPTMPARYAERQEARRGAVARFYERRSAS